MLPIKRKLETITSVVNTQGKVNNFTVVALPTYSKDLDVYPYWNAIGYS